MTLVLVKSIAPTPLQMNQHPPFSNPTSIFKIGRIFKDTTKFETFLFHLNGFDIKIACRNITKKKSNEILYN